MRIIKSKDPYFDPRSCTYKLSGKIRKHVDSLIKSDDVEEHVKTILSNLMDKEETNKSTLTYDSLVNLHKYILRADKEYIEPFYKFCDTCKCIKPKPRENKQLEERLKMLRLKDSQATYNSMTASVDRLVENKLNSSLDSSKNVYCTDERRQDRQSETSEFKKLNGPLVAVFNSFLVFICTFIFCYKALEYSLAKPNITAQVLFGLGGSIVVAIAELYFLSRVI